MMRLFFLSLLMTAVIALPLDLIWLSTMRSFYEAQMPGMLREQPRIIPSALFYVTFAAGLAFFAVMPNLAGGSLITAAAYGAALGFVAYGTYDATNYATLKDFPLSITIIDWCWGTVLSATTAGLAWLAMHWLGQTGQ
jgi:uncharacterized membrane protein